MLLKHITEYICDANNCGAKIKVDSSSKEYGYQEEYREMERRGWGTWGLTVYCKEHKKTNIKKVS